MIGLKSACVVGATGGIGAAVVRHLRDAGWSPVVQMDLQGDIQIDVTDSESVMRAFAEARQLSDSLDLLVVASGALDHGKVADLTLEKWNRILAINLTGPFLCCQAAHSWLADGSRVILLGSLAGRSGGVLTGTAYAVSKGGIESLTKSLAQELAPRRITVNCVAPGGVETPMLAKNSDAARESMIAATPLRRVATSEEIADTIAVLASSGAGFITGAVIPVNGGLRLD